MLPFRYDVFISYCRADAEQAAQLHRDLEALGFDVWRDERLTDEPDANLYQSIHEAHQSSAKVVVLWSEHSVGAHWVLEEAGLAREQNKIVCLTLAPFRSLDVRLGFRTLPMLELAAVAEDPDLLLGALGAERDPERGGAITFIQPEIQDHLPPTFATTLYGRDAEFAELTAAWDGDDVHVFAFDAVGGAGKTALIRHFMDALQCSGWRGARAVFAWSFYSQGSNEDRQSESTKFFAAAFAFFASSPSPEWQNRQAQARSVGQEAPTWPPVDEREKGEELARHVAARRALLVLDGLEPLQYAAGATGGAQSTRVGGIKDPALKALLEALVRKNLGLCIVTTRIELRELRKRAGFRSERLERLDTGSGLRLLRGLGVEAELYPSAEYLLWDATHGPGRFADAADRRVYRLPDVAALQARVATERDAGHLPPEFRIPADLARGPALDAGEGPAMPAGVALRLVEAVTRFSGHALSLSLVATYLRDYQRGRIEAIDEVPLLDVFGDERSPYSVMRAIETGLAGHLATPGVNTRQHPGETDAGKRLALLLFLGFFDRPAPTSLLTVVFPPVQLVIDPADDTPVPIDGLEKLYRRSGERGDEWRARAEAGETARRALFRALFPWTAGYDGRQLSHTLGQLAAQGLVHKVRPGVAWEDTEIDCHPLVREYFGARLRALDPATFRAAHGRLYDHYRYRGLPEAFRNPVAYGLLAVQAVHKVGAKRVVELLLQGTLSAADRANLPTALVEARPAELRAGVALVDQPAFAAALDRFQPSDAAGMEPLFAAITHGCLAGRQNECFNELYWPRVARGNQNFAAQQLGLYGPELAAIASFFDAPFRTPSPHLPPARQALVLNKAGFRLRALGRLPDAVEPMRSGANLSASSGDLKNAASEHENLSDLLLVLGLLEDGADGAEGAVANAERAVDYADRSGDAFMRMVARAGPHGTALLARGRLQAAEERFREAERLQRKRQPSLPRLYSLQGFLYGDLLVARGRAAEVADRWAYHRAARQSGDSQLDVALETLNGARAEDLLTPGPGSLRAVDAALSLLQRANNEDDLPRGYLALAEALQRRMETAGPDPAVQGPLRDALTEVFTIAQRGPMPLFRAEAQLLAARAALAVRGPPDIVQRYRDLAARLIAEHHYGRREPDLAVLDAEIAPELSSVRAACTKVGEEGWWHLLPRLERLADRVPAARAEVARLREAEAAYNEERDAYLAA